ncbi:MAG TPA: helix-turn-helix domain-containing protein [Streptosporangiaceae bacterium]
MRAARRIEATSAGDVERRYWAPGGARAYAVPRPERRTAEPARRAGERTARSPKLTAREAAAVLGLSQQELADLAASGVLRPTGPDRPEARRFPAAQVEAVLNGTAEPLHLVPVDGGAAPGPATSRGPRPSGDDRGGQPDGAGRPPGPPRRRRAAPRALAAPPETDPAIRAQARYLRALAKAITAAVGDGADCEMRRQEAHPFLPYLRVRETPVWAVSTSSGWRFLWNRYRSHPVTDAAGAAEAIVTDLGLRGRPDR